MPRLLNFLTPKQQQVKDFMDRGFKVQQIADAMGVSKTSVLLKKVSIERKERMYGPR